MDPIKDNNVNTDNVISDPEQKVGYKKPPINKQFIPGKSGNPKGRPKKDTKTLNRYMYEILERRVPVSSNGKRRTTTFGEVIATKVIQKAASGDLKAIAFVMDRANSYWMREKPYEDIKKIRKSLSTLLPKERNFLEYLEAKSNHIRKGKEIPPSFEDMFRFNTDEEIREIMSKVHKEFKESL